MDTIDCTPTWEGLLPALLAVVIDGTSEGQKMAKEQLRHMAKVADMMVEVDKERKSLINAENNKLPFSEGFKIITREAAAIYQGFDDDYFLEGSEVMQCTVTGWCIEKRSDNTFFTESYSAKCTGTLSEVILFTQKQYRKEFPLK